MLQYQIKLAIAGMVNGPPSAASTLERFEALHAYQSTWNTNRVPFRLVSLLSGPSRYSVNSRSGGDVLVYRIGEEARSLRVHRPASFFSHLPEQSWHVHYGHYLDAYGDNLDAARHDLFVAVDDAQDLIAMIGWGQGPER